MGQSRAWISAATFAASADTLLTASSSLLALSAAAAASRASSSSAVVASRSSWMAAAAAAAALAAWRGIREHARGRERVTTALMHHARSINSVIPGRALHGCKTTEQVPTPTREARQDDKHHGHRQGHCLSARPPSDLARAPQARS